MSFEDHGDDGESWDDDDYDLVWRFWWCRHVADDLKDDNTIYNNDLVVFTPALGPWQRLYSDTFRWIYMCVH